MAPRLTALPVVTFTVSAGFAANRGFTVFSPGLKAASEVDIGGVNLLCSLLLKCLIHTSESENCEKEVSCRNNKVTVVPLGVHRLVTPSSV